ncbi:uncharacterized protein SCHCODRAFT_02683897 [Schizophyllum commune H4-8]|uniref:Fungal-type protein kinase domain-containing protein n=1 Tax=Schizophyllum commune (strain H4-8 / FGSC 9210) TaxID=578458 RepID=D8PKS1_SCHCM|nr:uncharacterized protein SCHCODRAFT_02683897 [Schizophyllum commune H4-8]KAI5897582.1 hypothetical protein SCHCODRAFT_02683897 [Schizophyllum commune H4-8]
MTQALEVSIHQLTQLTNMESLTAQPYSLQCSVPEFYEIYVESTNYKRVPARTLARILSVLRRRGSIDRSTGEWTDLHGKGVASNDGRMKALHDHVLGAAAEVCPRRFSADKKTTTYTCSSGLETAADIPGATYYADAVSYLAQPSYTREATPGTAHNHVATAQGQSRIVYTADVGMTWGLTPFADSSHIQRNEDQTLYAAQHILYNDIRHTCQFAVTIEGSSVRLWYHTRSRTIFTERFDMHKQSDELIQIILFSSFASPAQLGFDPAVHRVVVGNELHYQFDVVHRDGTCHQYQSVEIEYEDAASNLHCQAMRVFKVVDCGNLSGPCRVLQDYWRSNDAEVSVEGKIQDAIFCAMEKTMTEDELIDIRRHFMTLLADGVVACADRPREASGPPVSGSMVSGSRLARIASGRKHCRTLHGEYCETLWRVDDPATFFFALYQVIQVLDKMRRAGYVHRDVSLGNIMLQCMDTSSTILSERYITKLADLEYARAYDKIADDRGVGTSVFMAVEVQAQEHIFANCREEELLTHNYFAHNPLHDVESTLWGAIYFTLRRCSRRVLENTDWKGQEGPPSLVRIADIDFNTGRIDQAQVAIAGTTQNAPMPDEGLSENNVGAAHGQSLAAKNARTKRKRADDGEADQRTNSRNSTSPKPFLGLLARLKASAVIYDSIFLERAQHFVDAWDLSPFVPRFAIDDVLMTRPLRASKKIQRRKTPRMSP